MESTIQMNIKKSIQYDELLILQKAIDERKRELKKDFPI